MTVNEIVLIVLIAAILVILPLAMKRIRQPFASYLKLLCALLLLAWVWFFPDNDRLLPKLLLTGVAVFGITRAVIDYVKSVQGTKAGNT